MVAPPKKALIAISSYYLPFYADGSKTGLFYGELAHPWHEFTKAGFEVDFVSESGTFGVDDHSVNLQVLSQDDIDEYNNPEAPISKLFKNVKKADSINANDYGIFFASAGHATLFDYPTATTLQNIASTIYDNGGVVSAVCHGPAIFANLNDKKTGENIIKGKKVTAFTDKGEEMMDLTKLLVNNNLKSCETIIGNVGGTYVAPPEPFADFNVIDGRVVTGPNPQSASSTAKKAIEVYDSL